jgi:DNA adenine methylase
MPMSLIELNKVGNIYQLPTISPTRPVLRYHGGKWMLADWIISHFPEHSIYVEPFGGAASVLMRKPRSYAEVYNDLDQDIVNLFRVLRDPKLSKELEHQLRLTPFSRIEFNTSYESANDEIERARRTVVRTFMGHGTSSSRKRRTGFRAKPFRDTQTGVDDWFNYPGVLEAVTNRLRGVIIECIPALELIQKCDSPNTFFYLDPPYLPEVRKSYGSYSCEMTGEDHRRLGEVLRSIKGMAIISGYPSKLYDEDLYRGWKRVERSALADGASRRTEVLWISPNCLNRTQQLGLF